MMSGFFWLLAEMTISIADFVDRTEHTLLALLDPDDPRADALDKIYGMGDQKDLSLIHI